jgi:hypothetical protein
VNCSGTVTIVQESTTAVSGGTLRIVPTPNSEGGGANRDVRGRKAPAPAEKRQKGTDVPTKIPAYASACSGAVRYSSACSCVGAKPITVTAAASTKKVKVTIVCYLHFSPHTTMAYNETKALS